MRCKDNFGPHQMAAPAAIAAIPRRRRRVDPWVVSATVIAVAIALPVLVVAASVAIPAGEVWSHLAATVLPLYVANSMWLMLGVGAGVAVLGAGTAWLVTMTRFPGSRVLEWALLVPLAVPAYVIAYAYASLLDVGGPLQATMRGSWGIARPDLLLPDIRSLWGAILVLTLVLYPYVYLLCRAAFVDQSTALLEASRMLGRGPWRSFFTLALPMARPAIAGGIALALMETLSEFGAMQHFGVQTFVTGIVRTWQGLGETAAAAQLAAILMLFVLALILLERWSRGHRRYAHGAGAYRAIAVPQLHGARAVAAAAACAIPVVLGFVVPAASLAWLIWQDPEIALATPLTALARNSFTLATTGAAVIVVVAIVVAYAMRLRGGPFVAAAGRVAALGYAIPGAVIAVGIMLPFAWIDNRIDAWLRATFGISTGLILSGTVVAVLFGYLVRFLALALNAVEASLARVTPNMDGAARMLGASSWGILRRVHAPLIAGGVLSAAIMVFVEIMKELPATLLMRPFDFNTLAVQTYQFASDERLTEAAGPALLIVAVGLLPVIALARRIAHTRPGASPP
jgi:iron(III) transport system permease protein